jgi:CRP/FNR family transcriptional regulator, cyclic AMP receptor protein
MLLPKEKVRLLSMVDILEPLSEEEIEELSRTLTEIHFEQGQTVYAPEDQSESLFMLKKGQVRIYKVTSDGSEFTLAMVEAGTVFGEMALTAQYLREVYAEATEPSLICVLKNTDLERLVRTHPEVGINLIRTLSERLRLGEVRLEYTALKDASGRLAGLILQLAASEGIMTPEGPRIPTHYTHRQLGMMIGASRETVTKAFTKWQRAGAVELRQRHIYIKDIEALENAAK